MISRHWNGLAKHAEADNYIDHLRNDTFPQLSKINGFIDASILRRSIDEGVDFLIVTNWESTEAIGQFAGDTADIAVVPPVVQAMMVRYDKSVRHYEVASSFKGGPLTTG